MNKKYEGEYLRRAHKFSMNNYEKLREDEGIFGSNDLKIIYNTN